MIESSEARELCSQSEWELVESSFSPSIEALPPADMKSRLVRAKELHGEMSGLLDLEHSEAGKLTTQRKIKVLAETIGRFEATLELVEIAQQLDGPNAGDGGPRKT
jgi:hypothetical protein